MRAKRNMRIAMMVVGSLTTPAPKGTIYAPQDIAISLAQGLKKRGHKTTFFAPEGSSIPGIPVKTFNIKPLESRLGDLSTVISLSKGSENLDRLRERLSTFWDQFFISQMFKEAEAGKYDLIHIHPWSRALSIAASHPSIPTAYTMHDPILPWRKKALEMFLSPNQHLIAISNNQRRPAPHLKYAATIYNGIDLTSFPFKPKHKGYFLWAARIVRDKNPLAAIQAAKKIGAKLIILGPILQKEYWDKEIKPQLGGDIQYHGFVEREKLHSYYQGAQALLAPISWEEPFGLMMVEAMACGTPVIAFNRGAAPEIVVEGKTGFLVSSVAQMASAMKKVGVIDRAACRTHVEKNFSLERMIDQYEALFSKLIK